MKNLEKNLKKLNFPENFVEYKIIKPDLIKINALARLKCQNCGLFSRAILCPPLLFLTYPQFKTLVLTKKWICEWDYAVILIFKNDGTKAWKDRNELSHIDFKIKQGKQLKGTEAAGSRALCFSMFKWRHQLKRGGIEAFGLINGHCDFCAHKCPKRNNPPCRRHGMPALESIGIDCYDLMERLHIEYQYPVEQYLTTMLAFLVRSR